MRANANKSKRDHEHTDAKLHRRASRATIWQLILAVLSTLIVAVPATYYFLTGYFDRTIVERIRPYEQLLYGSRLQEAGMYEEAVVELESGFNVAVQQSEGIGKSSRLAVYLEAYLGALGWVENPSKVRAQFEKCRDLFQRHLVTETSRHLRYEGWYLMRVGELPAAKEYFEKALRQATLDATRDNIAWGHYAVAYAALCAGDATTAHDHQKQASAYAPSEQFWYRDDDPQNLQLAAIYPRFGDAIKELQRMFAADTAAAVDVPYDEYSSTANTSPADNETQVIRAFSPTPIPDFSKNP